MFISNTLDDSEVEIVLEEKFQGNSLGDRNARTVATASQSISLEPYSLVLIEVLELRQPIIPCWKKLRIFLGFKL